MTDTENCNECMFQAFTKELEDKHKLKVAVIGAWAQLVQLREGDEYWDRDLEEPVNPDLCSVSAQLRQMECDWSSLQSDIPITQKALHKVRGFPVCSW